MSRIPAPANTPERVVVKDGMALMSVLLIILVLGITAIPMLELARQTKERALRQQILTLLKKEAKEYLEIGVYAVQLADGIPAGYSTIQSETTSELAAKCAQRIQTVDPKFLGSGGLSDNTTVHNSDITVANGRRIGQFVVDKSNPADNYKRYAIVSCATAASGELGIYGAEVASVNNAYYTISFGSF